MAGMAISLIFLFFGFLNQPFKCVIKGKTRANNDGSIGTCLEDFQV
jgi:hypothetical protein